MDAFTLRPFAICPQQSGCIHGNRSRLACAALRFEKQSITNTSASLGLRGEISHDTRWGTLLPFGRLELQHDFDHQSNMRLGYADLAGTSQSYSISSTTLGRNRVQVGFGSRLQSRVGTFAAEMQFTRSSHSFQRGLRLTYITRW